jgi:hypothetical protein
MRRPLFALLVLAALALVSAAESGGDVKPHAYWSDQAAFSIGGYHYGLSEVFYVPARTTFVRDADFPERMRYSLEQQREFIVVNTDRNRSAPLFGPGGGAFYIDLGYAVPANLAKRVSAWYAVHPTAPFITMSYIAHQGSDASLQPSLQPLGAWSREVSPDAWDDPTMWIYNTKTRGEWVTWNERALWHKLLTAPPAYVVILPARTTSGDNITTYPFGVTEQDRTKAFGCRGTVLVMFNSARKKLPLNKHNCSIAKQVTEDAIPG